MAKMTIQREKRQDWDVIRLAGSMTEEAGVQLLKLYDDAGAKCRFNFAGVQDINSNGVRSWMVFLRDFRLEREIQFEECSPAVVNQMNMMTSFSQKATILSVIVPLTCPTCQTQLELLVAERDFPGIENTLKPVRCKSCGSLSEPAEDGYFDFLDTSF